MPVEETYEDILANQPGYGEEPPEEPEGDPEDENNEAGQPPEDDTLPPDDTPAPPPEVSPEVAELRRSNEELRGMVRELTDAVKAGQKPPETAEEVDLMKVIDETFEPDAAKAMKKVLAIQEKQLERKYQPDLQRITSQQNMNAAERMERDALDEIAREEGLTAEETETLKADARKAAWEIHNSGQAVPPPKYVMADVVRKMKRQKGHRAADAEIAKQNDVRNHRNKNAGNPAGAPPATKGKISLSRKDLRGKSTLERIEMADAADDA